MPESLKRIDNLCHFSTKNRDKAPIQNPGEWRSLERILKDEDATKRAELLDGPAPEAREGDPRGDASNG